MLLHTNQQTRIVRLTTLVLKNPYNNTTKKEKGKEKNGYVHHNRITNNQTHHQPFCLDFLK